MTMPPCPVDPACQIDHSHATLIPNRARRDLLRAVHNNRVRRTPAGHTIRRVDAGVSRRCDVAVREMETAGWVRLGDGGLYELTAAGRAVLDGAR